MAWSGIKRTADSPLSDEEEKRHRAVGDSIVDDSDATIINSRFLSGTVLDDAPPARSSSTRTWRKLEPTWQPGPDNLNGTNNNNNNKNHWHMELRWFRLCEEKWLNLQNSYHARAGSVCCGLKVHHHHLEEKERWLTGWKVTHWVTGDSPSERWLTKWKMAHRVKGDSLGERWLTEWKVTHRVTVYTHSSPLL